MTMLDHALAYAAKGYEVFPCLPSKAPATSNGFHDATSDEAQIKTWWTSNPDALIGCAIPAGEVVIDVDPRNGGDKTLERHVADGYPFPPTLVARTGSGGWHRWYQVPSDVELRAHAGEGIDVKRHGKGYVIMPPSVSDAGPYRWISEPDYPADLPVTTLALLEAPPVQIVDADVTVKPAWMPTSGYGAVALRAQIDMLAAARPGGRNEALNRAAFQVFQLVAGGEVQRDEALTALQETAYDLGLEPREVESTLSSAWKAAQRDPRVAPERDEPVSDLPTVPTTAAVEVPESRYWTAWDFDEPPPPYYLDPILPKNAYVLVYGATEAAKSMTWNAILSDGSHHGVKSSVYSLENPAHVDRSRLRRLGPDPQHYRITHQPLDLAQTDQVEALVKREAAWGTDVVLIDTYSHAFSSRSEDGNAKAIAFARVVRHVMHEVGCSVIVIDHTGYMQREEPRDASAKRQQVDVAILMEKEGAWQRGRPSRFTMTNFKSARFGNPFSDVGGAIVDTADGGLELQWTNADFASRWLA